MRDHPELAFKAHGLAAKLGRRRQGFRRRIAKPVNKELQVARIGSHRVPRESIVAARQGFDAPRPQSLAQGLHAVGGVSLFFLLAITGHDAKAGRADKVRLDNAGRDADEQLVLVGLDQIQRLFVGIGQVIKRAKTCLDRQLDRVSGVAVGGQPDAPARRSFARSHHLFVVELVAHIGARIKGADAVQQELDRLNAQVRHLLDEMHHRGRVGGTHARAWKLDHQAHGSAGHALERRGDQTRPRNPARLKGPRHGDFALDRSRAAGKSARIAVIQHHSPAVGRQKRGFLGRTVERLVDHLNARAQGQMGVDINQARHQRAALAVYHCIAAFSADRSGPGDLRDDVSFNPHFRRAQGRARTVKQIDVLEDDGAHGAPPWGLEFWVSCKKPSGRGRFKPFQQQTDGQIDVVSALGLLHGGLQAHGDLKIGNAHQRSQKPVRRLERIVRSKDARLHPFG